MHKKVQTQPIPLIDLKKGAVGKLSRITSDKKTTQRLMDMGLTKNTKLIVERSAPFRGPLEISVRGTRLALGSKLAQNIFVKVIK